MKRAIYYRDIQRHVTYVTIRLFERSSCALWDPVCKRIVQTTSNTPFNMQVTSSHNFPGSRLIFDLLIHGSNNITLSHLAPMDHGSSRLHSDRFSRDLSLSKMVSVLFHPQSCRIDISGMQIAHGHSHSSSRKPIMMIILVPINFHETIMKALAAAYQLHLSRESSCHFLHACAFQVSLPLS